jgi:mono/diheme cytochrome c family protein
MKKSVLLFAIVAGIRVLTIPATAVEAPAATGQGTGLLTELGAADFRTYCAACHGVGGKGDGTVAEFLNIPAADLTQLQRKNSGIFPKERVTDVIDGRADVKVHGPRDMPVWGDWFSTEAATEGLDPEQRETVVTARINALIGFIETLQE